MDKHSTNKRNPVKLEELFHPAMCGLSRASLFLAIALNDKNKIDVKSWNIIEGASLYSVPIASESFPAIFDEFRGFIVKNSLREMIEFFEKTIIKIYRFFYAIEKRKEIYGSEMNAVIKKFSRKGFPDKLKQTALLINSKKLDLTFLQTIQDIRNIITHNMSIVDNENLILTLPVFNSVIKNIDTGEEIYIPLGKHIETPKGPLEFSLSIAVQDKKFEKGEIVSFSPEEIYYLLFAMMISIDVLKKEVLISLKDRKVPIIQE